MEYLKDAWYIVALAQEIEGEAMLPRKILNESMLIYRKASGESVVMHDRCPHRFAPLSLGKRVGDDVVCGYHALRFDCSGKCVHSQHGDGRIPKAATVRIFPSVEQHGFIWVWMGEAHSADKALIPDYSVLDGGHPHSKGYDHMMMQANYQIIVDNIMDLSHVDVVHGPLLSTAGKLSPLAPVVVEQGNSVTISWEWKQNPPMGLLAPFLPQPTEEANHHVKVKWMAPTSMLLTVGAVQGSHVHADGLLSWDHHSMTPETETSTHYFFATRRNWLEEDATLNQMKLEGTMAAFREEDTPIIEAVQREMGTTDLWSLNPVMLSSDPGAIRARRKLQALIKAQNAVGTEQTT